jgi:hypothetical protein
MNSATRLLRSIGRTIRVAPTMNDVIVWGMFFVGNANELSFWANITF